MTESSKPREFWIQKGTPDLIGDSWQEAEGFCVDERCELPIIHVIEKRALDEALARIAILESQASQFESTIKETMRVRDERIKLLDEVLEDSHATFLAVIDGQENLTLEQERIGNKGICIPAMRKIDQALASAREKIGGGG